MTNSNNTADIKKMTALAMFAAIAFLSSVVFKINVQFLTFDAKDAVIALCGLIYGPASAFCVAVTAAFVEMITVSQTGWYGFLMNFLSSAAFACTVSAVYAKKRTLAGAGLGLVMSVIMMVAVMITANLLITPLYMKAPRSVVIELIPSLLLPFNITKGALNAALTLLLYKPISRALKYLNILPKKENSPTNSTVGLLVTIIAILAIALVAAVFMLVLDGTVSWFST